MKYPNPYLDGLKFLRKRISEMPEDEFLQTSVATGMTMGQMIVEKEGESCEAFPCWMFYVTHGEHHFLRPIVPSEHYYGNWPFRASLDEMIELREETDTAKDCRVAYTGETIEFLAPLGYLVRGLEDLPPTASTDEISRRIKDLLHRAAIHCQTKTQSNYRLGSGGQGSPILIRMSAMFQNVAHTNSQFFELRYGGGIGYRNFSSLLSVDIGPTIGVRLDNTGHVIRLRLRDDFLVDWQQAHQDVIVNGHSEYVRGLTATVGNLQITHFPGQGETITEISQPAKLQEAVG